MHVRTMITTCMVADALCSVTHAVLCISLTQDVICNRIDS